MWFWGAGILLLEVNRMQRGYLPCCWIDDLPPSYTASDVVVLTILSWAHVGDCGDSLETSSCAVMRDCGGLDHLELAHVWWTVQSSWVSFVESSPGTIRTQEVEQEQPTASELRVPPVEASFLIHTTESSLFHNKFQSEIKRWTHNDPLLLNRDWKRIKSYGLSPLESFRSWWISAARCSFLVLWVCVPPFLMQRCLTTLLSGSS